MIYRDGRKGPTRIKRFAATGVMRDKEYSITKGTDGSRILYFTANPNGEAEIVKVFLKPKPKLKKLSFEFDFSNLAIKGKASQGNILTKHGVKNIVKREEGVSTLGALDIWYDDTVKRLNTEERGRYLGAFKSDDKLLTIQKSGYYKLMNYDLSNHFAEDMVLIEKFDPREIISVVYFESSSQKYYLKRFMLEQDNNLNKQIEFIGDRQENYLVAFCLDRLPQVQVRFNEKVNKKEIPNVIIRVDEFIGIKSAKAKGKRITTKAVDKIEFIDPLPYEEPAEESGEKEDTEKNDGLIKKVPKTEKAGEANTKDRDDRSDANQKTKKKQDNPDNQEGQMELF
jgi:topoisomerase-4 subunit A